MEEAEGMGLNPMISFPAGRRSQPSQYTPKLRETSLQFFPYQLSNLSTHPIPSARVESENWDDWMGQEEIPAWGDAWTCYLQPVWSAAVLRAAWRRSGVSPKRRPFPNHLPVPGWALLSRRLTAAAVFCLQPNTQKC